MSTNDLYVRYFELSHRHRSRLENFLGLIFSRISSTSVIYPQSPMRQAYHIDQTRLQVALEIQKWSFKRDLYIYNNKLLVIVRLGGGEVEDGVSRLLYILNWGYSLGYHVIVISEMKKTVNESSSMSAYKRFVKQVVIYHIVMTHTSKFNRCERGGIRSLWVVPEHPYYLITTLVS